MIVSIIIGVLRSCARVFTARQLSCEDSVFSRVCRSSCQQGGGSSVQGPGSPPTPMCKTPTLAQTVRKCAVCIWLKCLLVTVRNSSCRNVMFSQVSVILSTGDMHGEGRHTWQRGGHAWWRGACMAKGGGHAWWRRGMHVREFAWQGACVAGGCAWQGGMCGRRDSHCSGPYASYWNALLLPNAFGYDTLCMLSVSQCETRGSSACDSENHDKD